MRSSVGERFEQNINKCDVCFQPYNRTDRSPLILCSMHHTLCKTCVEGLRYKPNCPFCREKINFDKTVINNYIYELLPKEQDEAVPNVRRPAESQPYYAAPSVNNNNQIRNNYEPVRQEEDRAQRQPARNN